MMKFGTTIPLYYAAATTTAIAGIPNEFNYQ